ncbi:glycosyltransferase family 4 protein [Ramlibacter sp. G-1-2-2]|uniref:Glycosyltransferase family 4 protein n=1 Tax=Ramlibacter agri TaxID=2728837 RepID=A0A848HDB9_9BURK|nr:glycosyltransferase family 1 protein [Ramlibacter agri]NML45538.1 glycosyltransferase family 4 protein [Ramlibacter agri]
MKVLLDLKPAFDGHAGIPQETRLLFRSLCASPGYEVEGLIQHGARKLKAGIPPNKAGLADPRRINRLSRVIVSLYEKPHGNLLEAAADAAGKHLQVSLLRLKAQLGLRMETHIFEPALFDDFLWRTFFSMTLKAADKATIAGAGFRLLGPSRKMMHQVGLGGLARGAARRFATVDTRGFDAFVAQTPFPGRVTPGCRLVVRYHDAVPVLMPHTISDKAFHQASHFHALQDNVRSGAYFSCVSGATRDDLLKIFPEAQDRAFVVPNIVSDEYFPEDSNGAVVQQVIRNRLCKTNKLNTVLPRPDGAPAPFDYLLMVSTLEPRKNHLLLVEAWERLKYTSRPGLRLVLVGGMGWDHAAIIEAFKPWAESGDLFHLSNVPPAELRALYRHAAATVCPSLAEGFDYSGVEAMRSGSVVVASDIPVHREVYQDAAEYFDPYSAEDAAHALERVLDAGAADLRGRLRQHGARVGALYSEQNILPQWDALLDHARVHQRRPAAAAGQGQP